MFRLTTYNPSSHRCQVIFLRNQFRATLYMLYKMAKRDGYVKPAANDEIY